MSRSPFLRQASAASATLARLRSVNQMPINASSYKITSRNREQQLRPHVWLIFEDNYPAQYGDCYSLKKAFQHAGFKPGINPGSLLYAVKQMALLIGKKRTKPNAMDARYLKDVLEVYYEFPPVFKNDVTRWGDAWDETNYPTPDPLFTKLEHEYLRIFQEEATQYTWICLATLK